MMKPQSDSQINRTNTRIILPTFLAVGLFIISIFAVIIPTFRSNIMDRKREMIRELTNSAWSILQEYANSENNGILSKTEAQKEAVAAIRYLRYGQERKDYFWITDMHPRMIMHPYRPQLDGQDLSGKTGEDPTGKNLFVEMVKVCQSNSSGYVQYMWQWKDDNTRIVPKLSYVKHFAPWDWIIGTGIYIEDVKEEIAGMTGRLIRISLAIIFIISLLLFYISKQSLKIEKERKVAEKGLQDSEKKYRALVEATTLGTMMVLEGRYFYVNQPILALLEYSEEEFKNMDIFQIFADTIDERTNGLANFKTIMEGGRGPAKFEAILKKKDDESIDVELTISRISLGDEKGFVIMARDITNRKRMAVELDQSKEKYKALSYNLDIGVFRTSVGKKGKFIEVNPAAVKILGFSTQDELFKTTIFDLFQDKSERIKITKELLREGTLRNRILELTKKDGTQVTLSISCVLVNNENEEERYCDGIIEDITERKKKEESRENLIIELQTAQLYFNRSIKHFLRKNVTRCSMNTSIQKAAAIMSKNKYSAILVNANENETQSDNEELPRYIGIVTDNDLRKRVIAAGLNPELPIFEVMSSPLMTTQDSALIFETILKMQENNVRHLAVKDNNGNVVGMISDQQLLYIQRNSSAYLIKEIHETEGVEDIIATTKRMPQLVKALIDSGANSKNICRILSSVSDAVVYRLIHFALEEMGPPPTAFTFMALGSEGREEQTLKTDQDNAIIYEDSPYPQLNNKARDYFLKLGEKVSHWLDKCGYNLCPGEIMASNPKWCQPLSGWENLFSSWINSAEPQDLLEVNIFFDFRSVFGNKEITSRLRTYIDNLLRVRPAFFQYIARNALLYKPPIGFFGNIVVESTGQNPSTFDIKEAMKPIVNFARLYALKYNIRETNTQERLYRLYTANILSKPSYQEIVKVYDYLMQMRFKHQSLALDENRQPDNFINPKNLTEIEHSLLKNTFSQINNFQKRLSYDFTGTS